MPRRSSMLVQCIHVVYAARADVVRGAATRDRDPGGGCAAVGRDVSGTVVVLFTLGCRLAESGSGNSPARSAA